MPTHTIPISSLSALGIVTAQDNPRPTAMAIMRLSGATEPTLTRVSFFDTLLAVDAKQRLQAAGLRALCLGSVPTRSGQPQTTLLSDDDVLVRALPLAGVNEST